MSILAFAYACEPDKGSEPGAGWNLARALAALDRTCVITRANNAEGIERRLPDIPERDQLTFVYVDLPRWARFWKKGRRGRRIYYLLWQVAALRTARRVRRLEGIDTVWHLTLANLWMGSLAPLAGGRFVLGPVGGGATAPLKLVPMLGWRGALFELGRGAVTAMGRYANPLARLAWRRAELVLVQNEETLAWIPRRHRHKSIVFPNALMAVPEERSERRLRSTARPPTMLFAGVLLPLKGVWLAIKVLELLPDWRLVICGTGPDERRLRRLARRQDVSERVEFRGWVDRNELTRTMREEADVFIFPSLHDQSPLAVMEATVAGLPSVCLDRGGAKLLGAIPVPIDYPRRTTQALASAVAMARNVEPIPLARRSRQLSRLRSILARRGIIRGALA